MYRLLGARNIVRMNINMKKTLVRCLRVIIINLH